MTAWPMPACPASRTGNEHNEPSPGRGSSQRRSGLPGHRIDQGRRWSPPGDPGASERWVGGVPGRERRVGEGDRGMARDIMPHNATELAPNQLAAIAALVGDCSVTDAAGRAGVDRTTLHRWLAGDAAF